MLVVVLAAAALATQPTVALAANPVAPFTECPAVGVDTSCAILVVIQPDGSLTILSDPSQRPFDRGDDTLVGVLNNSGISVPSIAVGSSNQPVFGFEARGADGLCAFAFVGSGYCRAIPRPPTGYEGPDTSFTAISANKRDGTVRFTDPGGGLAAGSTTFFSLETAIAARTFGTGSATSLVLAGSPVTTADHADAVTVSATLKNGANPVPNAPLTLTLAPGAGAVSCSATTTAAGVATCTLTPSQAAGTYQLVLSYAGSSVPFLAPVNLAVPFTVTPEQDQLTYTGPSSATAGQQIVLSSVLTTDDPSAATALPGKSVILALGSGPSGVACTAVTDAAGKAACAVVVPATAAGPLAASARFVSDGFFEAAVATGSVVTPLPVPDVGEAGAVPWGAAALLALAGVALAESARRRR